VLVACADARRRRHHLEGRLGGFALIAWHTLERQSSLLGPYAHVLALDPPVAATQAALIDERFTLAWGEAETSYALAAHEAGYDLRPGAAAVYRALRDGAAGADALASGRAAPLAAGVAVCTSPAAAGRALRVLVELELIRIEGEAAVVPPARRTDLDRSPAFRSYATRLAEGRARLAAPARRAAA
jgi:hypothetical protein